MYIITINGLNVYAYIGYLSTYFGLLVKIRLYEISIIIKLNFI